VVLKVKTAYRDGTSHIVMSPLEFMQRLSALVPRPRLHLIRFHGVLAPHARLRAAIVPNSRPEGHSARSRLRARARRVDAHELTAVAQACVRHRYLTRLTVRRLDLFRAA
jgi:hypothetical protein